MRAICWQSQGPGVGASTKDSVRYGKPHLGHPEVSSPHLCSLQKPRHQPRTLSSHIPMPCQRLSFYSTSATTKDGGGGAGRFQLPYEPGTPWAVLSPAEL